MRHKRTWKQLSLLFSICLSLSLLLPTLASASMQLSGSYKHNNYLSGQLKFSGTAGEAVYGATYLPIEVYSLDGDFLQDFNVTFATYSDQASFFDIPLNTVISGPYTGIELRYNSVSQIVYRQAPPDDDWWYFNGDGTPKGSGGGGAGSGNGGNNGNTGNNGQQPADKDELIIENGVVDCDALYALLQAYETVTLRVNDDHIILPACALEPVQPESTLRIVMNNGTYMLPLAGLELDKWASQLRTNVDDMTIDLGIKPLTGAKAETIMEAVYALQASALSPAYDVHFTAKGKDGQSMDINVLDRYIKRIVKLADHPSQTATVVLYDEATKSLHAVPHAFDGLEASFWRTGNSTYVVIERNATFTDLSGHWAEADIKLMTSKRIVDGVTATTFEPDREVTRAEFVAMAVRALGLVEIPNVTYFDDVKASDWHAGVIAAAAKAGLVQGNDGLFRPNETITREELIAIVMRGYRYAGGDISVSATEQATLLSKWSDADQIIWGHQDVAKALSAGFIVGTSNSTLDTDETATRAQAATLLKRVLQDLHFMN